MKKLASLAAVCALVLTACSSESTPQGSASSAGEELTIGLTYVPDIQFAPMYIAEDQGYFADEGLTVTLRHHGAQEALLGALEAGEEEVVFAGGDEMMQGRASGIDVVNWATMYQRYPVTLIVPEDSEIYSASDLHGKKVGLPGPYGENYYALLAMLRHAELSEDDAGVTYIGYTQAAALESGDVDAIIGFSNSDVVNVEAAGIPVRTVEMVDDGLPLIGVGLGSLSTTLEQREEELRGVLAALERAVAFAEEHPDEALDITEHYVPALGDAAARETAAQILERTLALYTGAEVFGAQDAERWEAMSAFEFENGVTEVQVPASESFVDLSAH